jgi:hypothetical protein
MVDRIIAREPSAPGDVFKYVIDNGTPLAS